MTATPKRDDNIDTYKYFGEPIYTYSLRQGIADGFLAPYHVHRVLTDFDAQGWRPGPAEIDRYGRTIPDKDYSTPDFERMVALRARSAALAHHLTDFLKKTGRSDKTVVFCVDQEHALEMRRQLTNLNADITQHNPNYVCRVTSDEGDFGLKHLDDFQQVEAKANGPVILTTSQMLTTGVDMPTCKNIVIARVINSMTEFKQIIGRGTRVREDYDKVYFNIIDYTDSAIRLLTDPAFDGDPVQITREVIDAQGEIASNIEVVRPTTAEDAAYVEDQENETEPFISAGESQEIKEQREKYYFDGGQATIVNESRYELDAEDQRLKLVQYTEYVAGKVRIVTPTLSALRTQWADPPQREQIIGYLKDRGIDLNELLNLARRPDADPFDLLCNITFNAPIHTRRERANRVLQEQQAFFEQYSIQARAVLETMLEKYAEHGPKQLNFDVFKLPSFAQYGKTEEITRIFGGIRQLRESVYQLQALLYTDAA